MSLVTKAAPSFKTTVVYKDHFEQLSLDDLKGKYVVLFFYPLDFTFVCPTEIVSFQEKLSEFKRLGVTLLGCSVDSHFSHKAWLNTPMEQGGIEGVEYGLLSDLGGQIAQDYGVLTTGNVALRGLFLIDQKGIVRHQVVNDLPLGRSVDEVLRMVEALQHVEENGEVCPANWTKMQKAIKPTHESVSSYLKEKKLSR
jgi:peroxiredoxin (alkyl hydroperoxide reductase subunit C)